MTDYCEVCRGPREEHDDVYRFADVDAHRFESHEMAMYARGVHEAAGASR